MSIIYTYKLFKYILNIYYLYEIKIKLGGIIMEDVIVNNLEELQRELFLKRGAEYIYSKGSFKSNYAKLTFIHRPYLSKDPHEIVTTPFNLLNTSYQCEKCYKENYTNGIKKINDYLLRNKIFAEEDIIYTHKNFKIKLDLLADIGEKKVAICYFDKSNFTNCLSPRNNIQIIENFCKEMNMPYLFIYHYEFSKIDQILEEFIANFDLYY
jgi:hypothetical protein